MGLLEPRETTVTSEFGVVSHHEVVISKYILGIDVGLHGFQRPQSDVANCFLQPLLADLAN